MNINKTRLIEEFIELVSTDSGTGEEREIADKLTAKLKALGCSVYEDDAWKTLKERSIESNTGNLVAKLDGTKKDVPTLLFCAHMDRVTPGKGIKPIIENDIIKSDGTTILAADDVAGIVAILEGVRTIQENGIEHGDIEIVFTIAEEGGLNGAKGLDPSRLAATHGYFLDANGTVGTIVTSAPAQKGLKVNIYGKAAHAGISPESGISAILVAANALTRMQLGRIDEETTANIGIFQAGVATNIITEQAYLEGEIRSRNPEKLKKHTQHIKDVLTEVANEFGAKVEIEINDLYPSFNLTENDAVVQLALRAAAKIDLQPILGKTGGGSDANIINGKGIPSVVLGLGFEDVHSTKERIAISELENAARLVASLIKENK